MFRRRHKHLSLLPRMFEEERLQFDGIKHHFSRHSASALLPIVPLPPLFPLRSDSAASLAGHQRGVLSRRGSSFPFSLSCSFNWCLQLIRVEECASLCPLVCFCLSLRPIQQSADTAVTEKLIDFSSPFGNVSVLTWAEWGSFAAVSLCPVPCCSPILLWVGAPSQRHRSKRTGQSRGTGRRVAPESLPVISL